MTVPLRTVPALAAASLAFLAGVTVAPAFASTPPAPDVEVCADCHDDVIDALEAGPHTTLDGWDAEALSCSHCHGDGTAHAEDGGGMENIDSFTDASPQWVGETCLTCHNVTHPQFASTPHAQAGLSCTSCHAIHSAAPAGVPPLLHDAGVDAALRDLGDGSASCLACHGEVFTDFEFNERHRLREGILECTSCHDPHQRSARPMLAAFKQEACIECHADKGGPFVFEHSSSRVDGCVSCHSPHGSPNRHMLAFQSTAELCYSCHGAVPQFHFGFNPFAPPRFDLTTQCTNCHSTIHGSNFDPFFLE